MAIAEIRPGTFTLPVARDILSSPQKIEIPIPSECLRFVGEGKGLDLRHDRVGENLYRDYEVHCFVEKAQETARNGDQGLFIGPLLTDFVFSGDDLRGVRRPDFFKLGEELEFDEVKLADEFMNEVRFKMNEDNGLPRLAEMVSENLTSRIRKVVPSIYIPDYIIDPSKVRFRFISPTSQEGRTTFERWRTPHQVIALPSEIASALPNNRTLHAA